MSAVFFFLVKMTASVFVMSNSTAFLADQVLAALPQASRSLLFLSHLSWLQARRYHQRRRVQRCSLLPLQGLQRFMIHDCKTECVRLGSPLRDSSLHWFHGGFIAINEQGGLSIIHKAFGHFMIGGSTLISCSHFMS